MIVSCETNRKPHRRNDAHRTAAAAPRQHEPMNRPDPPAHAVLELERFLPYRLSVLTNRISQDIARLYADRFALGVTEWRVIAVLGRYPGLSANELAERTGLSIAALASMLLVLELEGQVGGRGGRYARAVPSA